MSLSRDDVGLLACPACRGALDFEGRLRAERLGDGHLRCRGCARRWPVRDGLARLVDEATVQGMDRFLRPIYELIAPFHDLGAEIVLPILQFPDPEARRENYIEQLALDALASERAGRPLRLLEVGIGGGANVPLLEHVLPRDLDIELWGVDLSRGMMRQCQRRLRWYPPERRVRLALADAHALPFPDGAFDRVFHVGAINGYHDRALALAEMARVARRGTPIVVVDEELDPGRGHSFIHRIAFLGLTWYDSDPHAPRRAVPTGAIDVEVTAISRFYYCLRFRLPAA